MSGLRIVMMGTGPFAVPTFRRLAAGPHRVAALVTRPPVALRGRRPPPNPMREMAGELGIETVAPENINADAAQAQLAALRPDLLVVCDYGQILASQTLAIAPLGGINLHGSLLPKYRGAAPVQWALLNGEEETGVSVIHMTPKLDAGPCLVQVATPIHSRETMPELEQRLAELGAEAVLQAIQQLEAWDRQSPLGVLQDPAQATRAPRLRKQDGLVDWSRSAREIERQVRALQPWPGTYTYWLRPGAEPLRLLLEQVEAEGEHEHQEPGKIVEAAGSRLAIASGRGLVVVHALRPAGKRAMQTADFLNGHLLTTGHRWGSSSESPSQGGG